MKQYIVRFREPVTLTFTGDRFNKDTKKWEFDVECEEVGTEFVFYSLKAAKAFIAANRDKYAGSQIVKTWSNGDWENLGEIKLRGSNKTYVANTKQKIANY